MYYRSQGYRYPRDMRIPINYGGNAFTENNSNTEEESSTDSPLSPEHLPDNSIAEAEKEMEEIKEEEEPKETEKTEETADTAAMFKEGKSTRSSLFGNLGANSLFGGRIGSEELLILAIVFLLSDTDSDNDIIWLLVLLLFIK